MPTAHFVSSKRLLFIDGLRGVAASLVVVNHFYGHLQEAFDTWLPEFIGAILDHGYLGVPIFFVISGFVIASNVGLGRISGSFLARFALRRSIRLDPPYWLAIGTAIAMALIANAMFPELRKPVPSTSQVLLHLVYLQNIVGQGDIVDVFWTLCLEVQFYLFIVLWLWCMQAIYKQPESSRNIGFTGFRISWLTLLCISILLYTDQISLKVPGLFLPNWFAFALGATTFWFLRGLVPFWYWFVAWAIALAGLIAGHNQPVFIATLATSGLLAIAGRTARMNTWLTNTPVQFLGRISYSLYLFHAIVGWSSISLVRKVWHAPADKMLWSLTVFSIGVLVSIITAWAVYRLIEKPSIALSRKVSFGETRP